MRRMAVSLVLALCGLVLVTVQPAGAWTRTCNNNALYQDGLWIGIYTELNPLVENGGNQRTWCEGNRIHVQHVISPCEPESGRAPFCGDY